MAEKLVKLKSGEDTLYPQSKAENIITDSSNVQTEITQFKSYFDDIADELDDIEQEIEDVSVYATTAYNNSISNAEAIEELKASQGDSTDTSEIEQTLATLETNVATNTSNISSLTSSVSSLQTDNTTNKSNISSLQTSVSDLEDNFDNYIPTSEKGSANGVASLNESGVIPSSQLPSYVDDVLEYSNYSSLPSTGESGKIYITTDDNLTYRWSGSTYVEISQSLALGETSSTAYAGDKGKQNADNISSLTTRVSSLETDNTTNKSDIDTLESNVSNLQSSVSTNTSNISSLQSSVNTLNGSNGTGNAMRLFNNTTDALEDLTVAGTYALGGTQTVIGDTTTNHGSLLVINGRAKDTIGQIYMPYTKSALYFRSGRAYNGEERSLQIEEDGTNGWKIAATTEDLSSLETKVSTAETNISSVQSDISSVQSNITNLTNLINTNTSNIASLTESLSSLSSSLSSLSSSLSSLQSIVNNLETDYYEDITYEMTSSETYSLARSAVGGTYSKIELLYANVEYTENVSTQDQDAEITLANVVLFSGATRYYSSVDMRYSQYSSEVLITAVQGTSASSNTTYVRRYSSPTLSFSTTVEGTSIVATVVLRCYFKN